VSQPPANRPASITRARRALTTAVAAVFTAALAALSLAGPSVAAGSDTVFKYSGEFAAASTTSFDGCVFSQRLLVAADKGFGPVVQYSDFSVDECTMTVLHYVAGVAPAEVFQFSKRSVHAVANVPLSDGSTLPVDLTWSSTGRLEHSGFSTRIVQPGEYTYVSTSRGSFTEATLTGSPLFDEAYISQNSGSSLSLAVGAP
jgi:hypothetical protein